MMKPRKSVYVKLNPDVVREVDVYAARHDLYRNEAMERLLTQAVESHGRDATRQETQEM